MVTASQAILIAQDQILDFELRLSGKVWEDSARWVFEQEYVGEALSDYETRDAAEKAEHILIGVSKEDVPTVEFIERCSPEGEEAMSGTEFRIVNGRDLSSGSIFAVAVSDGRNVRVAGFASSLAGVLRLIRTGIEDGDIFFDSKPYNLADFDEALEDDMLDEVNRIEEHLSNCKISIYADGEYMALASE